MTNLINPRPTRIQNVADPTDDYDAVPYHLVRDLIPTPTAATLDVQFAGGPTGNYTFQSAPSGTITATERILHPETGDMIATFAITDFTFSGSLMDHITVNIASDGQSATWAIAMDIPAGDYRLNLHYRATGTINGQPFNYDRNHYFDFTINELAIPYYIGTFSDTEFGMINTLTFTEMTEISTMNAVSGPIRLPLEHTYNEHTAGVDHPALLTVATVTRVVGAGFFYDFASNTGIPDGNGNMYNLYVTEGRLSAGQQRITFE